MRSQGGSADLTKQERHTRDAEGQTGACVINVGRGWNKREWRQLAGNNAPSI